MLKLCLPIFDSFVHCLITSFLIEDFIYIIISGISILL
jgi:hypothetical protein